LTKPVGEQQLLDAVQAGLARDRVRREEPMSSPRCGSLRRIDAANAKFWRSSSPAPEQADRRRARSELMTVKVTAAS